MSPEGVAIQVRPVPAAARSESDSEHDAQGETSCADWETQAITSS
jgi:hypothetical protein